MAAKHTANLKKQNTQTSAPEENQDDTLWWKKQSFDYVQVPKDLFRADKYSQLSPLSKLLYGFLLDRMNLSVAKGDRWKNSHEEYYVFFPIAEIMERFNCGHDKAASLLKELEKANLVSRVLKGRGLPYQITVKPFTTTSKNQLSKGRNIRSPDIENTDENNTDSNEPDSMYPDSIKHHSRERIEMIIKSNISYDVLTENVSKDTLDGIINIMVDILRHDSPVVRIFGEQIPRNDVRTKFLHINQMHIQYVLHRLKKETYDIQNLRSYIIARLYEAEDVMDSYYDIQLNHDMAISRKENLK